MMMHMLGRVTGALDWVAGLVVLASMFLVAGNVVLRPFNLPIAGTYEWTGFLTALAIGLALAHCAIKGGHTIITLVVDRLPLRVIKIDRIAVRLFTGSFLVMAAWRVAVFAGKTWKSGEVAPTTKVPFYPIMYIVAAGILIYAVVEFATVVELWRTPEVERIVLGESPVPDSCPVPPAAGKDGRL